MDQNCADPFAAENNSGTARFIGAGTGIGGTSSSAASIVTENAKANLDNGASCSSVSATHEFRTMKPGNGQKLITQAACASSGSGSGSSGNRHADLSHDELVKKLYIFEGELQARDVVIAALRNERVKQCITLLRAKRLTANDPHAAIFRDKVALAGNTVSRDASMQAAQAELEVPEIIERQMQQQFQMVSKQRATHLRMVNILTESLENNQRMLQELEEEKRKHEHDTAQGDDITYGLELERTKLRQELDEERAQLKKMEKDMKKLQETLDFERSRQKQIVLLLIAERKKILNKYIEEGKRSEDLAQILAEEKQRSDTIAEGLEEESKKSLRMEEELEKQAAAFEQERKALKSTLAKEEFRAKELEQELSLLRTEHEALKKQQQQLQQNAAAAAAAAAVMGAGKARTLSEEACAAVVVATSPMVNIAKIVQPTATVSSVPVSGPTTGIARSITPGQNIRSGVVALAPTGIAVAPTAAAAAVATAAANAAADSMTAAGVATSSIAAAPPSPSPAKMQPTVTIQRAPGGKYSALAAAAAAAAAHSLDQPPASPHPVPIAVPPVTVPPAGARGAPPPIPPNKPIVPPKREPSLSRLGSISLASGVSASGAAVAAAAAAATAAAAANTTTAANASANAKLT